MDTKARLITKSVTWQTIGLILMAAIGFLFSGSVSVGGGIAIASAIVGFFSYFAHELFWSRIKWGRH